MKQTTFNRLVKGVDAFLAIVKPLTLQKGWMQDNPQSYKKALTVAAAVTGCNRAALSLAIFGSTLGGCDNVRNRLFAPRSATTYGQHYSTREAALANENAHCLVSVTFGEPSNSADSGADITASLFNF